MCTANDQKDLNARIKGQKSKMEILKCRIRIWDIKIKIPAFAICKFQQFVIGIPTMVLESARKRLVAACIKGMRIFDNCGNSTICPQDSAENCKITKSQQNLTWVRFGRVCKANSVNQSRNCEKQGNS